MRVDSFNWLIRALEDPTEQFIELNASDLFLQEQYRTTDATGAAKVCRVTYLLIL